MNNETEGCNESNPDLGAESIPDTGAAWVLRVRSGDMTPNDHRTLRTWLHASAENERNFKNANAVWELAGGLAADPAVRAELAQLRRKAAVQARWSRYSRGGLGVAAAVVMSLAATALWQIAFDTDWYETAVGELRPVLLADGSRVDINTNSRIGVRFSAWERVLTMQRGEALFDIAPDPHRPFIVRAGEVRIRVVGTRFNVVAEDGVVTTTVLRGRIEVSAPGGESLRVSVLDAGESLAFGKDGTPVAVDAMLALPERIEGWRSGKWPFDGWTVERAVREYNRYSGKPVYLDLGERGKTPILGQYLIGDPDAFVRAVAKVIDGRVVDRGDSLLLVPKLE